MNKKIIIIIVSIIIILALVFVFSPKIEDEIMQKASIENLEKSTENDNIADIEAELNGLDINASSSEDFQDTDMEIQSL